MKYDISNPDIARNLPSSAELLDKPEIPTIDEPPVSERQEAEYQRRLMDVDWCTEALTELEDAQIVKLVRWLVRNSNLRHQSDIVRSIHDYLWPKEDEV